MVAFTSIPTDPVSSLASELVFYSQKRFTGRLDLQLLGSQNYSLYFSLGRLVWATGGVHPVRRWQRQLIRHSPQINPNQLAFRQTDPTDCWDYNLLIVLVRRKIAEPTSILATVQGILVEVLFDLWQGVTLAVSKTNYNSGETFVIPTDTGLETRAVNPFRIQPFLGDRPSSLGVFPQTPQLQTENLLQEARTLWEQWDQAKLSIISPTLAPIITQPEELQKQTSPQVYKNLGTLINGNRTLRDLAWIMKQEVFGVTRSLLPYIRTKLVKLHGIPDLPKPVFLEEQKLGIKQDKPEVVSTKKLLIACVDDSPQICDILEGILTEAGYKFLGITDALQALPLLLQHKPDLILLDLVMPIVNGYEICSQVRRISQFEKTPVIIVTGNDGIVDRVRAKMVGATDFLSKPIDAEKVLATVRKYQPKE